MFLKNVMEQFEFMQEFDPEMMASMDLINVFVVY